MSAVIFSIRKVLIFPWGMRVNHLIGTRQKMEFNIRIGKTIGIHGF